MSLGHSISPETPQDWGKTRSGEQSSDIDVLTKKYMEPHLRIPRLAKKKAEKPRHFLGTLLQPVITDCLI